MKTVRNRVPDLEERIIYEEEGVLIVNKPYDIPTSGKSLEDDDALQYWLMQREDGKVWAVHQLDADTTGVNIFVTRKKLVGKYQKALGNEESRKQYLAVVHGEPLWNDCDCREGIGYVDDRSLGVVESGKTAFSRFKVLSRSGGYSLVSAEIFTGRTHQIRIHLSHLGFPLVGEEWYCSPPCVEHPRQALHAYKVTLCNPIDKEFTANIPDDFESLLSRLKLSFTSEMM